MIKQSSILLAFSLLVSQSLATAVAGVSYNMNSYDATGLSGNDGAMPGLWTGTGYAKGYNGALNGMWIATFQSDAEILKISTDEALKQSYVVDGKSTAAPKDFALAVSGDGWRDTATESGDGLGLDFGLVRLAKAGNLTVTVEADSNTALVPAISIYRGWDRGSDSRRNAGFIDGKNSPLLGTSNLVYLASKSAAVPGAPVTLTLTGLKAGQYEIFVGGNKSAAGGYKYKVTLEAAPAKYAVVDLGVLGDGAWSVGNGVNRSGQVSGYSRYKAGINATHAYRYDPNGGIKDLGALPDSVVSGGTYSRAYNINDAGTVVGYSYYQTTPKAAAHAVVFRTDGTIQDLGTFRPGNDGGGTAHDINSRGFVTGYAGSGDAGSINYMPFLKNINDASAPLIPLGSLGGTRGKALALNLQNQVVGWSFLANDATSHAFLFEKGKMRDLHGILAEAIADATGSGASDINNSGWIAGSVYSPKGNRGYLYRSGSKVKYLGWLPGGSGASALGLNDGMQVVGSAKIDDASGDTHGFIYQNGVMNDLNTVVNTGDWEIVDASAISSRGHIVVSALNRVTGADHACLLMPLKK